MKKERITIGEKSTVATSSGVMLNERGSYREVPGIAALRERKVDSKPSFQSSQGNAKQR